MAHKVIRPHLQSLPKPFRKLSNAQEKQRADSAHSVSPPTGQEISTKLPNSTEALPSGGDKSAERVIPYPRTCRFVGILNPGFWSSIMQAMTD